MAVSQKTLPELIPLPATGLPADLLAARPDVRAAGLRLKEADWQVSAARADRLPAVTLSAAAEFSSDALNLLFSNWVATLAASLAGPLFDGGYRSAEVDRTRAVAEEYLTAYARTVAEAIREVEDSLVTETRQNEYIALLLRPAQSLPNDREGRPFAIHERSEQLPGLPDGLDQRSKTGTTVGERKGHPDQEPGDPVPGTRRRLDPGIDPCRHSGEECRRNGCGRKSAQKRSESCNWIIAKAWSTLICRKISINHPFSPRSVKSWFP